MTPNHPLSSLELVRARYPGLSQTQAVIRLCEQLLSEGECEPPVPVERLASLRGIVAIEQREQPWAGVLEPRDRGLVVGVRARDGYERQRFTICHETSHTLFAGYAEQRQYRCNGAKTELEQLCDLAATELLLPRSYFTADLVDADFDLDTVEDLATEYAASIEATALRLADLWPGPALVLAFRERHKPAERGREASCEPKLRLDYSYRSGSWPYLLRDKSVAESSPAGRAFAGERVAEIGALEEIAIEDPGPVEIHARRYGSNGRVLALIKPASAGERR